MQNVVGRILKKNKSISHLKGNGSVLIESEEEVTSKSFPCPPWVLVPLSVSSLGEWTAGPMQ